jgi:uncharacterized membrane protein YfcA
LTTETVSLLAVLIFATAMLYSSVGHAGASGYLAAMALLSVDPAVMKPTALSLNILVASIATYQFARAGCFSWKLFWPFAVASVPAAYIGGAVTLPGEYYRPLVGVVLLFAAIRLLFAKQPAAQPQFKRPSMILRLVSGAGIGPLSGLTGTGGGIFLTPLLLFMGWAGTKQSSGVSAAFILINSVAGLVGHLSGLQHLPSAIPVWATAAVAGGLVGSYYGSRRLRSVTLRRLLALVLVVAGLKLVALAA